MKKRAALIVLFMIMATLMSGILAGRVSAKSKGYKFTYKKATVYMHGAAKKLIKKAGKPIAKKASKSCAYDGQDITYKYKDFILYTYTNKDGGKEYVSGITFLTSDVKTKEKIKIGSSEQDMKDKYGDGEEFYGIYTYKKGKCKLQMEVKDGKVTNIRYLAL